MKIAMIGHKRIPSREGGVEIVVNELAIRMAKLGHDVTVYNRDGHHVSGKEYELKKKTKKKYDYKGVHVRTAFTIDKKGLAALTSSFFATWSVIFKRYNCVHYHAEGPCAMIGLAHFFGLRTVATIHGLDWQRAKWGGFAKKYLLFGEKQAAKYADEIIVLSENVKKYFKEKYNRETIYIPNGISKPKNILPNKISKWGLQKDGYILYLGRIVPEKGIHYLIEAYKNIKNNNGKKLVIAGGASDTDSYMQELIEKTKGEENIVFTGFVQGETLEELYSNAYVYVLPSDLEGMPISLLEAMSYGNCCVVSDIPECTEVVNSKAVVFKKSNVDDLTEKLSMLCEESDKVSMYKKETSDYICSKYNWDDIVKKTMDLYKN